MLGVVIVHDVEARTAADQVVPARDPLRVVGAGVVLLDDALSDLLPGRAGAPGELAGRSSTPYAGLSEPW